MVGQKNCDILRRRTTHTVQWEATGKNVVCLSKYDIKKRLCAVIGQKELVFLVYTCICKMD